MTSPRTRSQPMEFRQQEVGYVMERWRASDSCSLVGVGSVGKSNLLQHLSDPAVQSFYMTDVAQGKIFKTINIDPSMIGPLPNLSATDSEQVRCWAGYELLMHRLFLAFYPFDNLPKEDAQVFYDTYHALQNGNNPLYAYMGLRYFEFGLELFMKRGIQIVFMFDEFEEMLKQMPVKFFLTLRGLRDSSKKQLSFLTFTRSPLLDIVDQFDIDSLAIEPFTELFTDNLLYVGPYNPLDAQRMIEDLAKRNARNYDPSVLSYILWATGGYAGLIRSGFRALDTMGTLDKNAIHTDGEKLARELSLKRSVRTECRTLWLSLTQLERTMLKELLQPRPKLDTTSYDVQQTFAILQQKRLVSIENNRITIEPPVFRAFLASDPDTDT